MGGWSCGIMGDGVCRYGMNWDDTLVYSIQYTSIIIQGMDVYAFPVCSHWWGNVIQALIPNIPSELNHLASLNLWQCPWLATATEPWTQAVLRLLPWRTDPLGPSRLRSDCGVMRWPRQLSGDSPGLKGSSQGRRPGNLWT